jgi:hypothetical protein
LRSENHKYNGKFDFFDAVILIQKKEIILAGRMEPNEEIL